MTNNELKTKVLSKILKLQQQNHNVIIVHGGGPFIKQILLDAKIESEFIDGHRKTSKEAFEYVEMALKGRVNSDLVGRLNSLGSLAVGLSGKDGQLVIASKRIHYSNSKGERTQIDLGQVGDVANVNTNLLHLLLKNGYLPVVSCTAADNEGKGYNINADMFAGHIAGAMKADRFIVMTDVDGILEDKDVPESLFSEIRVTDIPKLIEKGVIQGGMIPKSEACSIALKKGARTAMIINGTKPDDLLQLPNHSNIGTTILNQQDSK